MLFHYINNNKITLMNDGIRVNVNKNIIGDIQTFKIVIIGDSSSGKSSILLQFSENTFKDRHETTIGVDLKYKYVSINGNIVKLHIWDTAGQERFKSIIKTYYETAHGIILVFDLNYKESFKNLTYWLNELKNVGKEKCPVLLVGNKNDLEKIVTDNEINNFMSDNPKLNIKYLEVSAKKGTNINDIFINLTKMIIEEKNKILPTKILNDEESVILEKEYFNSTKTELNNCCTIN